MKITIIPSDGVVGVDGRFLSVDLSGMPENIHAVQWGGTAGHIEYTDGRPNAALDDLAGMQPWIDRWQAVADIEDAPPSPLAPEQVKKSLIDAVQRHLDATVKQRGYDGILSLASYAASTHAPFAAEGRAGADWRDAVWGYCYQVMADVQAGMRAVPTEAELLAELPVMVWP